MGDGLNVKKGQPAVFLDRDGVLTKEKGYVGSLQDLTIFPYATGCVRKIHEKGYYAIVVTNQSGVARGLFTEAQLKEMNEYLVKEIGVDAVFYCPHHPSGTVIQYAKACHCRKPFTGMIEAACQRFSIELTGSWMVGDRASDIMTGKNAGLRTVLLESGYGTARLEYDITPDYRLDDLRDFIEII